MFLLLWVLRDLRSELGLAPVFVKVERLIISDALDCDGRVDDVAVPDDG